jgi:hypothetical protein
MARCDEGYLCCICGEEVKRLDQSLLYLRYVLGWVKLEQLRQLPEAHLQCSPAVAQFIVDPDFPPAPAVSELAKQDLDPEFRAAQEARVTAGYQRLKYLQKHRRDVPVADYPLSEARSAKR